MGVNSTRWPDGEVRNAEPLEDANGDVNAIIRRGGRPGSPETRPLGASLGYLPTSLCAGGPLRGGPEVRIGPLSSYEDAPG